MEIVIAAVVLLLVFGFVFSKKQKNNMNKLNNPTDTQSADPTSSIQSEQLLNQHLDNLNQEEHIKLQTQYLKFIAQQTERTAKNTAFVTWMYIATFIIGLILFSSISSKI